MTVDLVMDALPVGQQSLLSNTFSTIPSDLCLSKSSMCIACIPQALAQVKFVYNTHAWCCQQEAALIGQVLQTSRSVQSALTMHMESR